MSMLVVLTQFFGTLVWVQALAAITITFCHFEAKRFSDYNGFLLPMIVWAVAGTLAGSVTTTHPVVLGLTYFTTRSALVQALAMYSIYAGVALPDHHRTYILVTIGIAATTLLTQGHESMLGLGVYDLVIGWYVARRFAQALSAGGFVWMARFTRLTFWVSWLVVPAGCIGAALTGTREDFDRGFVGFAGIWLSQIASILSLSFVAVALLLGVAAVSRAPRPGLSLHFVGNFSWLDRTALDSAVAVLVRDRKVTDLELSSFEQNNGRTTVRLASQDSRLLEDIGDCLSAWALRRADASTTDTGDPGSGSQLGKLPPIWGSLSRPPM